MQGAPTNRDWLTGLPNRRALYERIAQCPASGAVLFIDVDGYAFANHALGHVAGDQLLVEMSQHLKDVLPRGGVLGRCGGDEFVVYVRDTAQAPAVAEQMRGEVESLFAGARALILAKEPDAAGRSRLAVSIGVAHYEGNLMDALRTADEACMRAKRDGGNRVVIAERPKSLPPVQ
jgi:diguanylate cyclase (GGDEF)-like protein